MPLSFETTQGPSLLLPTFFPQFWGGRRTWKPLDYPIRKVQRFKTLPPHGLALYSPFFLHMKNVGTGDDVKATTCSGNTKIHLAYECELLILIFGSHVPITLFCIRPPGVFLNVSTCSRCTYNYSSDSTLFVTTIQ